MQDPPREAQPVRDLADEAERARAWTPFVALIGVWSVVAVVVALVVAVALVVYFVV